MMSTVPLPMTDDEIIRSFPRYEGVGEPGFVIDFLGARTRTSYIASLEQASGAVTGLPEGSGSWISKKVEWAGVLRAVLEAGTQIVAVELGAGWGPWSVTVARAAQARGIRHVRLVGVEASKVHLEFMHTHLADNGIHPSQHTLIHGVVGPADGVAEFPILPEPAADYGAQAVFARSAPEAAAPRRFPGAHRARALFRRLFRPARRPHRGAPGMERVACYSVGTILRPFSEVDLVHFDIQGSEVQVMTSARGILKQKVKRIVVGTHGRAIEEQLHGELASQSWILEADDACTYRQHGQLIALYEDGCQVWRNPAWAA
jgi:FkbM family methyltransferase